MTDAQQLALLANATALADELLPRVCQQLTRAPPSAAAPAAAASPSTPPRPRTSYARQGTMNRGSAQVLVSLVLHTSNEQ